MAIHWKKALGIAGYGIALGLLLTLLRTMEYTFLVRDHATEIYVGLIALLFSGLGIWMGLKLTRPKKEVKVVEVERIVIQTPPEDLTVNQEEIKRLGISQREYEVLELMAAGLSNQEIADKLFVSLNTVKTHSARLFEKLDVNRRTQAVQKAKSLKIII